jgi:hypothetical protein
VKTLFSQWILPTGLPSAVVLLGYQLMCIAGAHAWLHPFFLQLVGFFVLLNLITQIITLQYKNKPPEKLFNYYLLGALCRILCCLLVVILALYWAVSHLLLFVGNFFLLYFLFVAFEIYFLLANLQANSN